MSTGDDSEEPNRFMVALKKRIEDLEGESFAFQEGAEEWKSRALEAERKLGSSIAPSPDGLLDRLCAALGWSRVPEVGALERVHDLCEIARTAHRVAVLQPGVHAKNDDEKKRWAEFYKAMNVLIPVDTPRTGSASHRDYDGAAKAWLRENASELKHSVCAEEDFASCELVATLAVAMANAAHELRTSAAPMQAEVVAVDLDARTATFRYETEADVRAIARTMAAPCARPTAALHQWSMASPNCLRCGEAYEEGPDCSNENEPCSAPCVRDEKTSGGSPSNREARHEAEQVSDHAEGAVAPEVAVPAPGQQARVIEATMPCLECRCPIPYDEARVRSPRQVCEDCDDEAAPMPSKAAPLACGCVTVTAHINNSECTAKIREVTPIAEGPWLSSAVERARAWLTENAVEIQYDPTDERVVTKLAAQFTRAADGNAPKGGS